MQRLRYQISGVYLDMINISNGSPEDIGPKCIGCLTQLAELKDVLIEVGDEGSFWSRECEVSKVVIQRLKTKLTIRRSGWRSL